MLINNNGGVTNAGAVALRQTDVAQVMTNQPAQAGVSAAQLMAFQTQPAGHDASQPLDLKPGGERVPVARMLQLMQDLKTVNQLMAEQQPGQGDADTKKVRSLESDSATAAKGINCFSSSDDVFLAIMRLMQQVELNDSQNQVEAMRSQNAFTKLSANAQYQSVKKQFDAALTGALVNSSLTIGGTMKRMSASHKLGNSQTLNQKSALNSRSEALDHSREGRTLEASAAELQAQRFDFEHAAVSRKTDKQRDRGHLAQGLAAPVDSTMSSAINVEAGEEHKNSTLDQSVADAMSKRAEAVAKLVDMAQQMLQTMLEVLKAKNDAENGVIGTVAGNLRG